MKPSDDTIKIFAFEREQSSPCSFLAAIIGPSGALRNAVFEVDAELDLSSETLGSPKCSKVTIFIFKSEGELENVSVKGEVRIVKQADFVQKIALFVVGGKSENFKNL